MNISTVEGQTLDLSTHVLFTLGRDNPIENEVYGQPCKCPEGGWLISVQR